MKITAKMLPGKDAFDEEIKLSVSKAKTFDDCKAKFKFNYIEKLPRKTWDFHVFGSFLHQVLEDFHGELIEHPEKAKEWPDVLNQIFEDTCDYEYKGKVTPGQIDDAKDIIDEYRQLLEEEGLPKVIAVEKKFYINVGDRVLLNGFIDRVDIDPDGVIHVGDYKTTKDRKYLKDFFQLKTYAFALMVDDPTIKRVRASFILLRHGFDLMTEEYTREDIFPIGEKFIKYADSIKDERLWRPNPQFLCKYCDFQEHCEAGTSYLVKKGVINGADRPVKVGLTTW